jgi:hypothetical protein
MHPLQHHLAGSDLLSTGGRCSEIVCRSSFHARFALSENNDSGSSGRKKSAVSGTSSKYSTRRISACAIPLTVNVLSAERTRRASSISLTNCVAASRLSRRNLISRACPPSRREIASRHVLSAQSSHPSVHNAHSHTWRNPSHIEIGMPIWATAEPTKFPVVTRNSNRFAEFVKLRLIAVWTFTGIIDAPTTSANPSQNAPLR